MNETAANPVAEPQGRALARVLICCGSGGVGKTTTSAALAVKLAREGRRVAVLTIDPARRLADALAVGTIGNAAVRVPFERLGPAAAGGELDAMMLDAKRTFDDVIARFAPSVEARERILRNHYYELVSTRLAGAHEYMAMEKLYELATSGRYDVIVLDTPPSRHALDFVGAPDRMSQLMDEGVMRWLTLPASTGGWRMIERGSEVMARVLKGMLGERTISDIAEFFTSFSSLWSGFRERSLEVRAMLRAPSTQFLLVTTPSPPARHEALHFLRVLHERRMPFAGFLINRCVTAPVPLGTPIWPDAPPGVAPEAWRGLLDSLDAGLRRQGRVAAAEAAVLAGLQEHASSGAPAWKLPDLDAEIHDLEGLGRLAAELPDGAVLLGEKTR